MDITENFKKFLHLFLTAVTILLYPLLLIVVTSLFVYRFIITTIAKRDPGFSRVITGADACFAGKDPCNKPSVVMAPFYVCTAKVDKYEVMRVFTEKILKPEDNGGKVLYPEMTQKIVTKYGYHFWYENSDFNLENHIKYINEDDPERPLTRLELQNLTDAKLIKLPYDPNHSPWEILIVRNFIDSEDPNAKSAMVLRLQHCLFDGHSLLEFLRRIAVKPWTKLGGSPKAPIISTWQKILHSVKLFFVGPYHFLHFSLFTKDSNKWTNTLARERKGQVNFHNSTLIPLKTIKAIKNHYNVSFTSVLFTVLVEGLRKTMETQDANPEKIYMTTAVYMPGRPNGLTNYWASAKIECRLYKNDLEQTLRYIEDQLQSLRHSLLPTVIWSTFKFVGLLPVLLHPDPHSQLPSTLLVSNLPGPAHPSDMFGYHVSGFGYGGSPLIGYASFAMVLSYKGYFRVMMAGDKSVLPSKRDAIGLVNSVEETLNKWLSEVEKKED